MLLLIGNKYLPTTFSLGFTISILTLLQLNRSFSSFYAERDLVPSSPILSQMNEDWTYDHVMLTAYLSAYLTLVSIHVACTCPFSPISHNNFESVLAILLTSLKPIRSHLCATELNSQPFTYVTDQKMFKNDLFMYSSNMFNLR